MSVSRHVLNHVIHRMARTAVAAVLGLMLACANVNLGSDGSASAQSRDPGSPSGTPSGKPGSTTPPSGGSDTGRNPGRDPGGPGGGGLPDAGTVIDILRLYPGFPGRQTPGDDDDDARPPRVVIDGGGATPPPRRPSRVSQPVANVPVTPRPEPRDDDAPPVVVGTDSPDVRPNEVIVVLAAGATDATVFALARAFGLDGETLYTSNLLAARIVRFRIPDQRTPAEVVTQLSADARVRLAQPNYLYVGVGAAGGAATADIPQYAPEKLRLAEAHRASVGKRVRVAVIDTAIDDEHPALEGAVTTTFDALGEGEDEPEFHGTAIAGIVAARTALMSVAPAADVIAIRAFADDNGTSRSHSLAIIKAVDFAVARGARVINMSFAGPHDALLEEAIGRASEDGAVIVAAAGNGGPDAPPAYPAAFDNAIAVSATGPDDDVFDAANQGGYIAISAPGVDIVAPSPGGAYDITSGTSMAAAHISGIAALLLEQDPTMTPDAVRERLLTTARKAASEDKQKFGAGIADAAAAVTEK